jgi:hypothetical protein
MPTSWWFWVAAIIWVIMAMVTWGRFNFVKGTLFPLTKYHTVTLVVFLIFAPILFFVFQRISIRGQRSFEQKIRGPKEPKEDLLIDQGPLFYNTL